MNTKTFFSTNQSKPLCVNQLRSFWLWLQSSLLACLPTGISFAHRDILDGLTVYLTALWSLLQNKRLVVGCVLMLVGVFGIFFHQLFFDPWVRSEWYYVNSYYFYFTLRPYVVLILWSAASILFVPITYKYAFIPASIFNAIGWGGLFHYSFFVDSNEAFHVFPMWPVLVAAIGLGFSIVMALDFLLYWTNHKMRGNHCRFVGTAEMDLTPEQKEPIYKALAKEFRKNNKMI